MYNKGARWPLGQKPPEGSGIELALREDAWELAELKGFDVSFNTLHGSRRIIITHSILFKTKYL